MTTKVKNLIVITGLSGAGISSAARAVEDCNIRVVSNPPISLLDDIFNAPSVHEKDFLGLVIPLNSKDDSIGLIDFLKHVKVQSLTTKIEVWYLNANNEVLLSRYRRQRRPHLFEGENSSDILRSVDEQRDIASKVFDVATWVIDTSESTESDLRHSIIEKVNQIIGKKQTFDIDIFSFGIEKDRHVPVDFLFNCRDLPNPYWDVSLKNKNGLDVEVKNYVLDNATSQQFLENIELMVWNGIALAIHTNRAGISLGFGCTGGQHRSVAVAEEIAKRIKENDRVSNSENIDFRVNVSHLAKKSWH